MKTKYKWIRFQQGAYDKNLWRCYNKDDECLGEVSYEKGWRQFVFCPNDMYPAGTIYNFRCLEDIADFLKQLNKTKGCYKEK